VLDIIVTNIIHPKNVLTYGTYDLFHVGHARLLERASGLGDRLFVGVSSDSFNAIKGKECVIPYDDRAEIVAALRHVHHVFPENDWEQKVEDIQRYNIDVFVMGDDWAGEFDHLKAHCEVVYLPRTEGISTTSLKDRLYPLSGSSADEPRPASAKLR
jgi:glycerol-3-phosphate cytidylyltransferase